MAASSKVSVKPAQGVEKKSGPVQISHGLVSDLVPESWKPFVRLLRLTSGVLLTFWPCAWGTTLVAIELKLPPRELAMQIARFYFYALLAHSIGCIWNDMCDRDLDKHVSRTKDRPLASGKLSLTTARITFVILSSVWIWSLWGLNTAAFRAAVFSLFFMSVVYPYLKRMTDWPQIWLAVTSNMGLIISWLEYKQPDYPLLTAFMAAAFCWIMITDSWNGYLDREDDIKAGVRGAALILGDHPESILSLFAFGCTAFLVVVGILSDQSPWFYILTVGGAACHLAWQIRSTDVKRVETCSAAFHSNGTQFGYIVWSGLLASYMKSVGTHYL